MFIRIVQVIISYFYIRLSTGCPQGAHGVAAWYELVAGTSVKFQFWLELPPFN